MSAPFSLRVTLTLDTLTPNMRARETRARCLTCQDCWTDHTPMNNHVAAAAIEARAALARGQQHAQHYNTLAWEAALAGDMAQASDLFEQALRLDPHDAEALIGLAGIARAAGRLSAAVQLCDRAIAAHPQYPEAWLERALVMHAGGAIPAARECYLQVVALVPDSAAAHAGLAAIAARDGDAAAGLRHGQAALRTDPDNAIAAAALAVLALEAGDPAAARGLVEPRAARRTAPDAERIQLRSVLGDACDKLGDPAAAYAAYAQSKADFAALYAPQFAGRPPHRDWLTAIAAALPALNPQHWPAPGPVPAAAAARHLFVLGYPRSGNTLLENVLASLPGVAALEERATLHAADIDFLAEPAAGLPQLQALTETSAHTYREAYWRIVTDAGVPGAAHCFVDMDPLKGSRLALIARLFPQAKVLLLRRDPRDVVWSCFRTSFALTNAAMDFVTLERTAQHYAAMMALIEQACAVLPLNVHAVSYEGLVRDFDTETQALCGFAGLDWSPQLRQFDRTAQRRGVATASASQVRKGLYDGSGQWQPYAQYLAPVMPILAPWIERLGYSA